MLFLKSLTQKSYTLLFWLYEFQQVAKIIYGIRNKNNEQD